MLLAVPYPDGEGDSDFLVCPFTIGFANSSGAQWRWENNDEDRPTIRPSMDWKQVWHGWVTDGEMYDA